MIRSRFATLAVVLAAFAAAGGLTVPLSSPAWRRMQANEPALRLADVEGALGQGMTIGLLGGFRAVIADLLWLQTNLAWEDSDLPATQTLINLVTAVDSRPLYFWINGARMIAYDMPVWRIDAAGGYARVPEAAQRRIAEEQAQVALALLERALAVHPDDPVLFVEMANIHLRRRQDAATAAAYYRRAAEQPGGPFYAGRIYAELLRRLGRPREAYLWLRDWYARVPRDNPMAAPEIVLGRIRELEEQLDLPPSQRYHDPPEGAAPASGP